MNIKQQERTLVREAEDLLAKSRDGNLTPVEADRVKEIGAELESVRTELSARVVSDEIIKQLGAQGKQTYDPNGPVGASWGVEGRGHLRLKADAGKSGQRLAAQIPHGPSGAKSLLASGSSSTAVALDPTPIPLGQPAQSIFDVLPSVRREVPVYKYLRQTTRTNNAAVVAVGGTKPTSTYTLTEVDGSLVVIAHLSQAIDSYTLTDNEGLSAFVASELSYGLSTAVEAKVVTDVLATSGIQTQAYATDVLTTTRTSVTDLEAHGGTAAYWLMNPTDWQAIELTTDSEGRYLANTNGPIDVGTRRLWSAPVVTSGQVDAGTALLFGTGAVELSTDGIVSLVWGLESGDFETNQVRARCESRYNTDVLRPWAVVKTTLTSS